MSEDTKRTNAAIGRWLRVGVLTLTTFGPIINSIASQLRQRAEIAREEARKRGGAVTSEGQERLLAVGTTLADALVELKDHPYSQEIIRRGGDLSDALTERSGKLSRVLAGQGSDLLERGSKATQVLTERGNDVVGDLAERGNKATQVLTERGSELVSDLAERSSQVSKDVAKRTERLSKEVAKRSERLSREVAKRSEKLAEEVSRDVAKRSEKLAEEVAKRSEKLAEEVAKRSEKLVEEVGKRSRVATEQVSERKGLFWSIFGFSLGLSAAMVGVFWLIRRRMQERSLESQSFQITQNGHLNGNTKQPTAAAVGVSASQPTSQVAQAAAQAPESATPSPTLQQAPVIAQAVTTEEKAAEDGQSDVAVGQTPAPAEAQQPLDAKFIGLVSSKLYYPIETPVEQLSHTEGEPLDVVYFESEEEAQAQGFSAAAE